MKILCFTTSFKRPYHLYHKISAILNQTYSDIHYSVNVNIDTINTEKKYAQLFQYFTRDPRLKIQYNHNSNQQINYLRAINGFGDMEFDLYFKIDDDDIYQPDYIEKSIKLFEESHCDILSYSKVSNINGGNIQDNPMSSIGVWQGDKNSDIKFGMSATYIFNKKACDIIKNITNMDVKKIHLFEDAAWRTFWRKNNIVSHVAEDTENLFTYNIHNSNTSSTFLLKEEESNDDIQYIDNSHATIVYCKHPQWQSYLYLNKRNNKMYNIKNNDHGSFTKEGDQLHIMWDVWGKEQFVIKESKGKPFYEFSKKLS